MGGGAPTGRGGGGEGGGGGGLSADALPLLATASPPEPFARLGEAHLPDADLDVSVPGARRKLRGPEAELAAHRAEFRRPGRLVGVERGGRTAGGASSLVWIERNAEDARTVLLH